jgi:hypothetical protein
MAENGTNEAAISAKQRQAILALLSTKSVAEAAKAAKVGERTLWRWLGYRLPAIQIRPSFTPGHICGYKSCWRYSSLAAIVRKPPL